MEPAPDDTVRSTAPETLRVRSNEPSGACAEAGAVGSSDNAITSVAAHSNGRRNGSMAIMTTHDLPVCLDEKGSRSVARAFIGGILRVPPHSRGT